MKIKVLEDDELYENTCDDNRKSERYTPSPKRKDYEKEEREAAMTKDASYMNLQQLPGQS